MYLSMECEVVSIREVVVMVYMFQYETPHTPTHL